MKKQWIIACLAGVLTTGAQAQQSNYVSEVWIADQGNGTYKNLSLIHISEPTRRS